MKRMIILVLLLAGVTVAGLGSDNGAGLMQPGTTASTISRAIKANDDYSFNPRITVAGDNAPDWFKNQADYVCTGNDDNSVDDAVTINAALIRAYTSAGGWLKKGGVVELRGSFYCSTPIVLQPRVSMIADDNLQGTALVGRADITGPVVYYNANGPGREGQFEFSGFLLFQYKTAGDEPVVKLHSEKYATVTASASLAANPPIEGSTFSGSGGGTGIICDYTATTTVILGPDEGDSFSDGEVITYTGTSGAGTFTISGSPTLSSNTQPTKDCIFENCYITYSTGDGWHHDNDWSGHYENMTFEFCQGNGFTGRILSFTEFNGCYFAHNTEHGFSVEGTLAKCAGVMLTSCWSSDNGDVQLGNNPAPNDMEPYAGFYIYVDQDVYTPSQFVNCAATMNSGSGFYAKYGWHITFADCYAAKNNWQGLADTRYREAGFRVDDTSQNIRIINCFSQQNDLKHDGSEWITGSGDAYGSGFYIDGNRTRLIGCSTEGNRYGVWCEAQDVMIDIRHGKDTRANIQDVRMDKAAWGSITGRMVTDTFNDPGVADDDGIYTHALNNHATTTAMTQPTYSRAVKVVGTDGTAAGTVTLIGYDSMGTLIDAEYITVSGTTPVTTNRAYSRITSLSFSNGTGSADVGWVDILGLSHKIEVAADVIKVVKNGSVLATSEYAVNASSQDAPYGTVTLTTAISGSDIIEIVYRAVN